MSGPRGVATVQEDKRLPGALSMEAMSGSRKRKQMLGEKGKLDRADIRGEKNNKLISCTNS